MKLKFLSGAIVLPALLLLSACKDPEPLEQPPSDSDAVTATKPTVPGESRAARGIQEVQGDPAGILMPEAQSRDDTTVDTRIVDVTLSNRGDTEKNIIGGPTSLFDPQDTVYAEVHSQGTAREYTLYAKWISADGNVLSDYGVKVNQPGDSRTLISLSKPDGLMTGENRIEVAINAQPARIVTFRVR